jgi:hypothetical protein
MGEERERERERERDKKWIKWWWRGARCPVA